MHLSFKPKEIDDHILKLTVGFVGLTLATLTAWLSNHEIGSISDSYYAGDWARNIFVGFLFAISSFLFAYNGDSAAEMIFSKIAAVAGLGVALFPCHCGESQKNIVTYVHYTFAAIMFGVLACLCVIFYRRARAKGHREAIWRSYIYATCAIVIVLVIAVLGIDDFTGGHLANKFSRLTLYGEAAALIAFGVSWLVASRVLPFITQPTERISLLPVARS